MRQFSTIFLLATATTVSAVVPHTFSSGKTAVAQDVNENFVAMDTAIQNRATKAELADKAAAKSLNDTAAAIRKSIPVVNIAGKADSVWVAGQLAARSDTSKVNRIAADLAGLTTQVGALPTTSSLKGIRDTLRSKQENLGFAPANKAGETFTGNVTVNTTVTVGGMVSAGGIQTGGTVSAAKGKFDSLRVGAISGVLRADQGVVSVATGGGQPWVMAGYFSGDFNVPPVSPGIYAINPSESPRVWRRAPDLSHAFVVDPVVA